jgi:hypothetical protein
MAARPIRRQRVEGNVPEHGGSSMSAPQEQWEAPGDPTPRRGRQTKPDRLGPALVAIVLVALVVAVLLVLL